MITKRTGHGQTVCKGCKDKGKFGLTWDSFLYNFNDEPYCFDCLMEKLEELQQEKQSLKDRIEKAIEKLNNLDFDKFVYSKTGLKDIKRDLLKMLGEKE